MADQIGHISITKPEWYQDPLYQKTQDQLLGFGTDLLSGKTPEAYKSLGGILEGNIPDYYKSIGESGGPDFMNMLNLVKKNTTNAVNEDLIRRGVSRGGIGASVTSKAIADATTKLSYDDYQRALTGKMNLFNTGVQAKEYLLNSGLNTVSGVRSGALDYSGLKNQFGMGIANLDLGLASKNAEIDIANAKLQAEEEANKNEMWSNILSSSIGALGTIGGGLRG